MNLGSWILTLYRHAAAPTRPATRFPTTSWHAQLPAWYALLLYALKSDTNSDKFDRYASSPTRYASWIPATRRPCWLSAWRYAVPASRYGTSWYGRTSRYASLPGQEIEALYFSEDEQSRTASTAVLQRRQNPYHDRLLARGH